MITSYILLTTILKQDSNNNKIKVLYVHNYTNPLHISVNVIFR